MAGSADAEEVGCVANRLNGVPIAADLGEDLVVVARDLGLGRCAVAQPGAERVRLDRQIDPRRVFDRTCQRDVMVHLALHPHGPRDVVCRADFHTRPAAPAPVLVDRHPLV